MSRCAVGGCDHAAEIAVWSPLFRNADQGPTMLCESCFGPHRERSDRQGWWVGADAIEEFHRAGVFDRVADRPGYEGLLVVLFRCGTHFGGSPLGSELGETDTAVYTMGGKLFVVTCRWAIELGTPALDAMRRVHLPRRESINRHVRRVGVNG